MPKDSHLLPDWSQVLLRDARSGRLSQVVRKNKENAEDDDADGDDELGFAVTRWRLVPKHLEGPETEFLAKRRKGLSSLYGATSEPAGNSFQMRKTKMKKTNGEGHESVFEVFVPYGQRIEGEVAAEENMVVDTPAPGTVVDGVGIVNAEGIVIAENQAQQTPPRRKPPPPKRKAKGPARGQKKKVAFAPGAGGAPSRDMNGVLNGAANGENGVYVNGDGARLPGDGDVDMGDDSMLQDGEELSEDDEEGEEGEEGDEREDGELSPTPSPVPPSPAKQPSDHDPQQDQTKNKPDIMTPERSLQQDPSSSPDMALNPSQTLPTPAIHIQPADNLESTKPPAIPQPADTLETPDPSTATRLDEAPYSEIAATEDQPQTTEIIRMDHPSQILEPMRVDYPPQILEHETESEPPKSIDPATLEEPPQVTNPAVHAEISAEHNVLNGFSEPQVPTNEPANTTMHFSDDEEDLLGSLERHLEGRS